MYRGLRNIAASVSVRSQINRFLKVGSADILGGLGAGLNKEGAKQSRALGPNQIS